MKKIEINTLNITTTTNTIKKSHLFVFFQDKSVFESIPWVKIDKKIRTKIWESVKDKKDSFDTFYLWESSFEYLTVAYFHGKWEEKRAYFLSQKLLTLWNEVTLFLPNGNLKQELFDTFIFSTRTFDTYKSEIQRRNFYVLVSDESSKKELLERYETLKNVLFCRDLGNTPACDLTPEIFVKKIQEIKWKQTKVKVWNSKHIQKEKLGLIHAVWKWSSHASQFVILERIVNKKFRTIGFVWKGVIFDTGGLNIKVWDGMFEMKQDMNGAATVLAVMKELERFNDIKVNIIAAIPLVENAVSNEAFRPSDIVTSYTGKEIQITNTDAEWRLVLADAVGYISTKYNLSKIITVATLTGACMVALGFRYAGIMGTDKETIDLMVKSGKKSLEKYCELPFDEYFIEKTKSKVADFDNRTWWPKAGATMWAAFIANFLTKGESYTHIDIAWASINSFEPYGYFPTWATGFWVLSLSSFFKSF